jgi:hypothetical protein
MMPVTIFTWGYYGWGNHTQQLVEAVDASRRAGVSSRPCSLTSESAVPSEPRAFKETPLRSCWVQTAIAG